MLSNFVVVIQLFNVFPVAMRMAIVSNFFLFLNSAFHQAFPMRPQHFFTNIHQAMADLDWSPKYDTVAEIMKDSYENDFVHVKASGGLKNDFECDDIVIASA